MSSHRTIVLVLIYILTKIGDYCRHKGNPLGACGIWCIDHEEYQHDDGTTADQEREVKEEGESFAACYVNNRVIGNDIADGEGYQ